MLIISESILRLILGWEGLGVRSFFLINYHQTWERLNNSMYTILTIRVGEIFLFIILIRMFFQSYIGLNFVYYKELNYIIFVLLAFTKSVQIPFRAWLPKAMSAPTPTRALVHRSTLVVAGLVVLILYREAIIRR